MRFASMTFAKFKAYFNGQSKRANQVIVVVSVLGAFVLSVVAKIGDPRRLLAPQSLTRDEISGLAPFVLCLVVAVPVLLVAVKQQKAAPPQSLPEPPVGDA